MIENSEVNLDNPWVTLSQEMVYDNYWINVFHENVINPNKNKGIYGVVHFKNFAIGVIPLDENNNTWIVGQYRYPIKAYSWEIPEGGGMIGVDPIESAKRELIEECGLVAEKWDKILEMHLSNSVSDELSIIYVARGLSQTVSIPDDTELLQVKKIPFSELFEMVMNGEITDAMSVAAVLKLKILLDKGEF